MYLTSLTLCRKADKHISQNVELFLTKASWWVAPALMAELMSHVHFAKTNFRGNSLCLWALMVDWNVTPHRLASCLVQVCSCTKRFSVQSSSVVTRQSIWEMKTCTPVTCCVQCFLESHYFWINLCWWQFHCLLLWWYYYGAFILLLFLCRIVFIFSLILSSLS